MTLKKKIEGLFQPIINRKCWYVSIGGCSIPAFSLALGKQIKRNRLLANDKHPHIFRTHQPEAAIYVWCDYRLENKTQIIIGSDAQEQSLLPAMNQLVGKKLHTFLITMPGGDLLLKFSGGLNLRIFCNRTQGDCAVNWTGRVQNSRVVVGPGNNMKIETTRNKIRPSGGN